MSLGAPALSDVELIAILLGTGSQGQNVISLAQTVLSQTGGLAGLARYGVPELARIPGVGPAKASRVVAALCLASRVGQDASVIKLRGSAQIVACARARLVGQRVERVLVLVADSGLRLLNVSEVAVGGAGTCQLPIREVLSAVLRHDGVAFALAHNHPGGDPTPTDADQRATELVAKAAAQVGLRFLDHVVVTDTDWRSVIASS